MKIALFGGSGKSGLEFIPAALKEGHSIKALVRTPDKLKNLKEQIEIIQGSVEDSDLINKTIQGCDCVVSVLGHSKNTKPDMQTESIKKIIDSMNQEGIKRLIVLTGAGVFVDGDKPGFLDNFITFLLKLIAKSRITDGENFSKIVMESNLNWTVLRVPLLTNGKYTGKAKLGVVGDSDLQFKISRKDLASTIVKVLDDTSTFKKAPFLAQAK